MSQATMTTLDRAAPAAAAAPAAPAPADAGWFAPGWKVRATLKTLALTFLGLFIVLPAVNVFAQAFSAGWAGYTSVFHYEIGPDAQKRLTELHALQERLGEAEIAVRTNDLDEAVKLVPALKPVVDAVTASPAHQAATRSEKRAMVRDAAIQRIKLEARAAKDEVGAIEEPAGRLPKNWISIRMTIGVALIVVPLNLIFGVAAAWAVTKYRYRGKTLLVSLIDLPFSVSPVVAGLVFVLLFGREGFLSSWAGWDRVPWLGPFVHALRWVPVLAAGAFGLAFVAGAIVRRCSRDPVTQQASTRRVRLVLLALAAIAYLVIALVTNQTHPNLGWGWLRADDWIWKCPTWRGFGGGRWWPLGLEPQYGVIFTPLAVVLASIFVTFPFVARSLIPLMDSQGVEAEQAALTLGASGWYTFRRVTLPAIKWGLLYGAILCTARALGEFGAVSVVSGSRDTLSTMPLRVEQLWAGGGKGPGAGNQGAFAIASILCCLALVTLVLKAFIEWKTGGGVNRGAKRH